MEISNDFITRILKLKEGGIMSNKKKIFLTIILILVSIVTITNVVYAADSIVDPREDPTKFEPGSMTNTGTLQDIGNKIIGIIQVIGSVTSVIVLIVIGIKYMVGSLEERAEYKKTMMPYIIGALFVFGITNILGIVSNITNGLL